MEDDEGFWAAANAVLSNKRCADCGCGEGQGEKKGKQGPTACQPAATEVGWKAVGVEEGEVSDERAVPVPPQTPPHPAAARNRKSENKSATKAAVKSVASGGGKEGGQREHANLASAGTKASAGKWMASNNSALPHHITTDYTPPRRATCLTLLSPCWCRCRAGQRAVEARRPQGGESQAVRQGRARQGPQSGCSRWASGA